MSPFGIRRPIPCRRAPAPTLLAIALILIALPAPGPAQEALAEPAIAFEPGALVVSGVTPGADVVIHGVAREHLTYLWRVVSTRQVVAADAEGQARLDLPDGIVPVSTWTVVDAATGAFTIASPGDFAPEEIAFPGDGLGRDRAGAWRALHSRFERAEVLYVRPGAEEGRGAWWLVAVDGSASDEDDADDSALAASLEHAQPFWGDQPPPDSFAAGDVVVAVSLDTLDFFASRLVAPGPPTGSGH